MKIDSVRVAKRLGVSKSVVRGMAVRGILRDLNVTADGAVRHNFRFDSREITSFQKSHRRMGRNWVPVEQAKPTKPTKTYAPKVAPVTVTPVEPGRPVASIFARLDRIEALVTKLVGIFE